MKNLKKLTLLHSNDLHGDFLAEKIDDKLVGGASFLSGYIKKVRQEEENVVYCIAGDMFRGSVIDSEFLGLSTIELMNILGPDVVTIGNHETDYGLAHLLFIEKCSNFPIINANLLIKMNGKRLFKPYEIVEVGGMKILFIGITTEEVIANTKSEGLISTFIDVSDAAEEVGRIINGFKGTDIDFTVLLTHIGYDEDIKLAEQLDPELGVDIIVGGHSHTFMDEPTKINDILIVQAGTGTDQIGRFDIMVDTDNNCIDSYTWKAIPINNLNCERDMQMAERIRFLKNKTDMKYERVIFRTAKQLSHPTRYAQTQIGSLYTDTIAEALNVDIAMLAGGSIRKPLLGPVVMLREFVEMCPFTEKIYQVEIDGHTLKKMLQFIYRPDVFDENNHCEFYQISSRLKVHIDKDTKEFKSFSFDGDDNNLERLYTISMPEFHFLNCENFMSLTKADINKHSKPRVVCSNWQELLKEQLSSKQRIGVPNMDRVIFD